MSYSVSTLSPTPCPCVGTLHHLVAGLVVTGLLLAITAGSGQAARSAAPLTKVSLVLKWVPQAQFAGYYVALKKGYYPKYGLDLDDPARWSGYRARRCGPNGGATFGLDWLSSLLVQRDHGQNLVNIAQVFQTTGMRLITFKTTGITNPKDFKGKKIGVWFSGNQYQFLAWMAKLGYNPDKDMTVIHQGFDMNSFLSHQVDMASAMTYNELGVVLESGIKMSQLNIFNYQDAGVTVLEDGLYARGDYLKAHPDVATKFLEASIMGWQDVLKDPAGAAKIVESYDTTGQMKLAHQVYMAKEVNKLVWWGPAITHGIGYMDPAAFTNTSKILLQQKIIKKMPTGAYDQSYWQAAVKALAAQHLLKKGM